VGHQERQPQTHELPEQEEEEKILAGHEEKEDAGFQGNERKKTEISRFSREIAKGVDLNHRTHPGDQEDHDGGKAVHSPDQSIRKAGKEGRQGQEERAPGDDVKEEKNSQEKGQQCRDYGEKNTAGRAVRRKQVEEKQKAPPEKRKPWKKNRKPALHVIRSP
jgi:hypothetical protein